MTQKELWTAIATIIAAPAGPPVVPCPAGAPVLFVNAALLTMDAPVLLQGATVLVRGGRIEAISPAAIPGDACRIDGTGKVLLPGLTDMHVHTDESELPLFLANGVTFVREMNGSPALLALRDRLARGELAGPRMQVTSPLLVGTPLRFRHLLITSPEEARKAARDAKEAGYDYLKIYDGLSRASYDALVEAGATLGIPLDGHIPADVGLERVLEAGQFLQHTDKTAFALGGHSGDTTGLTRARQLFAGRKVWFTPTLASLRVLDGAGTTEYVARLNAPELAWVDDGSLAWWRSLAGTRTRTGPSPFFRFQMALLPVLRESGARFLLGTDAANPMMVAGFSVHDELESLVRDGGFTPWQALLSATRNVGEFLGEPFRGRIVAGAPADLLLVEADPLDDLSTLRHPLGVMANGRWYTKEELAAMLTRIRRR